MTTTNLDQATIDAMLASISDHAAPLSTTSVADPSLVPIDPFLTTAQKDAYMFHMLANTGIKLTDPITAYEWPKMSNGIFEQMKQDDPVMNLISLELMWSKQYDKDLSAAEKLFGIKARVTHGLCVNIEKFATVRSQIGDNTINFLNLSDWNQVNYNIEWSRVQALFVIYGTEGFLGIQRHMNQDSAYGEWVHTTNAENIYMMTDEARMLVSLFTSLAEYDAKVAQQSMDRLKNWESGRKDEKLEELKNDLLDLIN